MLWIAYAVSAYIYLKRIYKYNMFVWILLMALLNTVVYLCVYVVWGKVDTTMYAEKTCSKSDESPKKSNVGCVDCDAKPVPIWAYFAAYLGPDVLFGAIVSLIFAIVILCRTQFGWFNKQRTVSWSSHSKYFVNPIVKYVCIVAFVRIVVEMGKILFNQEKAIYSYLLPTTASAIKSCVKADETEQSDEACPLFLDDIDKVRPGGGGSGLGLHPILVRHGLRNSLIHGIVIVYGGIGLFIANWLLKNMGNSISQMVDLSKYVEVRTDDTTGFSNENNSDEIRHKLQFDDISKEVGKDSNGKSGDNLDTLKKKTKGKGWKPNWFGKKSVSDKYKTKPDKIEDKKEEEDKPKEEKKEADKQEEEGKPKDKSKDKKEEEDKTKYTKKDEPKVPNKVINKVNAANRNENKNLDKPKDKEDDKNTKDIDLNNNEEKFGKNRTGKNIEKTGEDVKEGINGKEPGTDNEIKPVEPKSDTKKTIQIRDKKANNNIDAKPNGNIYTKPEENIDSKSSEIRDDKSIKNVDMKPNEIGDDKSKKNVDSKPNGNIYAKANKVGTKSNEIIDDKNNDTEINPENISVDIQDKGDNDKPTNQTNKNFENN